MCRLFAFRSVINSQVHSSLVHVENALIEQSKKHPDGWGVAYYRENIPHLLKSTERALDDTIFHRISGVVSSQTVLAHIRKATQGTLSILNSHPFQYGQWIFAHNGNLKNFEDYKFKIIDRIAPELKRFIFGTTDSEVIFYLLLTFIKERHSLDQPIINLSILKEATEDAFKFITRFSGPLYGGNEVAPTENHLSFILTTGQTMIGFNGGQTLRYSTFKKQCPDRNSCDFFSHSCENEVQFGSKINHLIFSSEYLEGENIWRYMPKGTMVGVNKNMEFLKFELNLPFERI